MNFDTFTDNHLCNFYSHQLDEMFDWDAVADLPDNRISRKQILLLSQFLVGNIQGTLEQIKKQRRRERFATFDTWISVIRDIDTLKPMTIRILYGML